MKQLFPVVADVLFYTACAWLVLVAVLRWLRVETAVCFLAATLLSLALAGTLFLLFSSRRRRRVLGKAERENRDKLLLHLALESDERVRALLLEGLLADGREAHCREEALEVDGVPFVPVFTMQPLSADTVAHLLKRYRETPFVLACNALSPEAERLLTSFSRKAMTGEEVYDLLSRTGKLPEHFVCGEIPRSTAKTRLRRAVARRNATPFFVCGTGLLVMSLFVFFPVYYLVAGAVLLSASVLIRAFGRA